MKPPAEEPSEFGRKTFLEHLQDLRDTLIWSLLALVVGILIAVPLAPRVYSILKLPLQKAGKDPETFLTALTPMGYFNLSMLIIVLSGLAISLPVIVFFIAGFVFPGLTRKERKAIRMFGGAGVLLFMVGVATGYFVVLPVAFKVMFGIAEWIGGKTVFWVAGEYVMFCLYLMMAFGLAFELPVVLVMLGYLGLIDSIQLRSSRIYAMVIILIAAMVITPTTDLINMLVMAIPMMLMYEISIWIIWLRERRERSPRESGAG